MSPDESFEAMKESLIDKNEAQYGDEVRRRWGDQAAEKATEKFRGLTKEDFELSATLEEEIKQAVLKGLATGDPDGTLSAQAASLHAKWLKLYWPDGMYSLQTHASLAEGYLADERFKTYYDAWADGATEFLAKAIKTLTQPHNQA